MTDTGTVEVTPKSAEFEWLSFDGFDGPEEVERGATLSLARLTQMFDIDVPAAELRDLRPTPTLRPENGVSAVVQMRNKT